MLPIRLVFASLCALAACSDDEAAAPDAAVDAEGDSGLCGATGVLFTGELLDFDATSANAKGVANAAMTVRGDTTKADTTGTTGRFELCLTDDPQTIVDVVPDAGSGYIGGTAIVTKEVASSGVYSIRAFTSMRATAGFGFDAAKAHVFVHVAGMPRTVTITSQFERPYSFGATSWMGGSNTGTNLYFANVDPTGGTTKMTAPDSAGIPAELPLEAGKLTFVVIRSI